MNENPVVYLDIDLEIDDNEVDVNPEIKEVFELVGGSDDYLKLKNKPSINGQELINNYNEIDPTVPSWAKQEKPPTYTAADVGAYTKQEVNDLIQGVTTEAIDDETIVSAVNKYF